MLDDFCTVEHAKAAYGVVVDLAAEQVDETATESLRAKMRSQPSTAVSESRMRSPAEPPSSAPQPGTLPATQIARPEKKPAAAETAASAAGQNRDATIESLREAFGEAWSFDVVYYTSRRGVAEVRGELRANGTYATETGVDENPSASSIGASLQAAADQSLVKCAQKVLRHS
ncbi:MAG: hypothetical protein CM1200mP20_06840 [Pseudomonadota bacterium]|nr:MAG: hypothetical protein CM1200mP20_06840 [Pseudomonadota bacterium]